MARVDECAVMCGSAQREKGPAGIGPRTKKHDEEGCDSQESAKRKLVATGDGPTQAADSAEPHFAGAPCEGALPARGEENNDHADADDSAKECAEHDGEECGASTEKSSHHEHHFDVAEPHAIAAANEFVEDCCGPK